MEEDTIQPTPMGRVWKMVLISALFVFSASWLWHWSEIRSVEMQGKKDIQKILTNIAQLSAYRDVLKKEGKEGARVYIEQLQKTSYGI